ncbi:MmpS family transport accessory protein, partial [Mycobacterium sp.]|uniref:MmpS family transport accessory protein n=1 Tax=Mycobacterium sp. TaxID=1785 RepID=UPI003BAF5D54
MRQRVKGISIFRVLERAWIPLVIAIVIGVGGFTVFRIHGIFGSEKRPSYSDSATDDSKPFNPKRITYEVYGPPGTTADISYFDTNADPQHVDGAKLP